jgi:hypothetical protein
MAAGGTPSLEYLTKVKQSKGGHASQVQEVLVGGEEFKFKTAKTFLIMLSSLNTLFSITRRFAASFKWPN